MSVMQNPYRGIRPWRRHSLVLFVGGSIYLIIGWALIAAELTASNRISLQLILAIAPIWVWGIVFIIAGTMAIISSRWPPISETWGYTVLTGLSSGWAGVYLVPVILGESPTTNLRGTMSWGLLAFMWWAISGLTNPVETVVIVEKE
jgi:hypothetical protein